MRKEISLALEEAVVLNAETKYMNNLRHKAEGLMNRHSPKAEELLGDLLVESRRLDPKKHTADEEEHRLWVLENKK
jgi:hypothetical protein